LGRVIQTESASRERTRLSQSVVLALRELMKQTTPDEKSRDLVAYISLALVKMYSSVDASVTAWEKKGYWLKADRFRMEWEWTQLTSEKLAKAISVDDWGTIAMLSAQVGQKFFKVKVAVRNRIGTPWDGAYELLRTKQN
jgi:hypothetical protein